MAARGTVQALADKSGPHAKSGCGGRRDIGVQGLSAGNHQYDRAEDQCAAKSVPKKER